MLRLLEYDEDGNEVEDIPLDLFGYTEELPPVVEPLPDNTKTWGPFFHTVIPTPIRKWPLSLTWAREICEPYRFGFGFSVRRWGWKTDTFGLWKTWRHGVGVPVEKQPEKTRIPAKEQNWNVSPQALIGLGERVNDIG